MAISSVAARSHCQVKPQHHLFRLRTSNQPLADGEYVSSYKNMDVANIYTQEELIKEATGSNNTANQPMDNNTDWKDDCYAINESGEGICEISENGDLYVELYDYPNVFSDDNPMTESSYDSSLCNNKFSAIDVMSKGQYPQLNEFCAIYYPDYVDWDN